MANQLPSLPLDMVEHIQSYMSYKDATRSASICRRIYYSWYTRKHNELDERVFANASVFWEVGLETVERYQNANLKLEKFSIRIVSAPERELFSAAVIEGAAKLGAREITITLYDRTVPYRIPHGVFESGDLVTLKVIGGALRLDEEIPVICSSLKNLVVLPLAYMRNVDNDILQNYLLRCPNLHSLNCRGALIRYNFSSIGLHTHNLNSLWVETMSLDDHFWITYFITILTGLKILVFRDLPNCNNLLIRSKLVEIISIKDRFRRVEAILIVPNIVKFHYNGNPLSKFTFRGRHGGMMSSIHVNANPHHYKWFWDLHSLLNDFAGLKIYVSVTCQSFDPISWVDAEHEFDHVRLDVLDISKVIWIPSMLDSFLRVCKPRLTKY